MIGDRRSWEDDPGAYKAAVDSQSAEALPDPPLEFPDSLPDLRAHCDEGLGRGLTPQSAKAEEYFQFVLGGPGAPRTPHAGGEPEPGVAVTRGTPARLTPVPCASVGRRVERAKVTQATRPPVSRRTATQA